MKWFIAFSAAFGVMLGLLSTALQAGEPRLLGCYDKVLKPAQYSVKKTKIKDAVQKYIQRNGRYELVEFPAVYQEERTLIRGAYYVMQEIPCK